MTLVVCMVYIGPFEQYVQAPEGGKSGGRFPGDPSRGTHIESRSIHKTQSL